MKRRRPNILITGTPGTGKSTLSSEISDQTGLEWLNIGEIAKANDLYEDFDSEFQCHILDEDKVISELEDTMKDGGKIVDYHGCDFFPEKWFDIVFVLQTDNTILYDRLVKRGYSEVKLQNNIEAEIFHTLLDEAQASYQANIVHPLKSDTPEDMENNIEQIVEWIRAFEWDNRNG